MLSQTALSYADYLKITRYYILAVVSLSENHVLDNERVMNYYQDVSDALVYIRVVDWRWGIQVSRSDHHTLSMSNLVS